jgi:hypothetical protein
MAELNDAVDGLMDEEMWVEVAAIGGGYLGTSLAQSTVEGTVPFDLPNEAYGAVGAAGFLMFGDSIPYADQMAMGAGLYTVDALAQRVGVKDQVTNIGGGA